MIRKSFYYYYIDQFNSVQSDWFDTQSKKIKFKFKFQTVNGQIFESTGLLYIERKGFVILQVCSWVMGVLLTIRTNLRTSCCRNNEIWKKKNTSTDESSSGSIFIIVWIQLSTSFDIFQFKSILRYVFNCSQWTFHLFIWVVSLFLSTCVTFGSAFDIEYSANTIEFYNQSHEVKLFILFFSVPQKKWKEKTPFIQFCRLLCWKK